jgi:hypothetical protein
MRKRPNENRPVKRAACRQPSGSLGNARSDVAMMTHAPTAANAHIVAMTGPLLREIPAAADADTVRLVVGAQL